MYLVTILAGLLTFAIYTFPFAQWFVVEFFFAIYSCGDSPGFTPDSLFIPNDWKPKFFAKINLYVRNAKTQK